MSKKLPLLLFGLFVVKTAYLQQSPFDFANPDKKEEPKKETTTPNSTSPLTDDEQSQKVKIILNENNKYIVVNQESTPVLKDEFDDAGAFTFGVAKISKNKKWGIIDTLGRWIVPLKYDYIWSFTEKTTIVENARKYGLLNTYGQELTPIIYDYIDFFKKGWAKCLNNGVEAYLNYEGKEYANVEELEDGWFKVKKDHKWGFVDKFGYQIVSNKYEDVKPFYEDFAMVNKSGKWEYINRHGDEMPYDEIFPFSAGFALVRMKQKYFYINRYGKEYDSIGSPIENRIIVTKNDKYGVLKPDTKEIVAPTYDWIGNYTNAYARFKKNDLYGFLDSNGREVISAQFEKAFDFTNQRARIYKNKKFGFIKPNGTILGEIIYSIAEDFKDNLAKVYMLNKFGFIDTTGTLKILPLYSEANDFYQGFAKVKNQKDKWVYINTKGEETPYDEIFPLADSVAMVRKLNKYGYINASGNVIVPGNYEFATDFQKGFAMVNSLKDKTKKQYINKTGSALPFDDVFAFYNGLAKVEKMGKYGFINDKGVEVIPAIYSAAGDFQNGIITFASLNGVAGYLLKSGLFYNYISTFKNNVAIVKKLNKYGLIDISGSEIVPATNDAVYFLNETPFIAVQNEGKTKLFDKNNKFLKYDNVSVFSEGFAVVSINNKYGFIDIDAKEVVACEYDWADAFRNGKALVQKDEKMFYINAVGQLIK